MEKGPGRFGCVTYMKAWVLGAKDWAAAHIDHCDFCRPVVYGDDLDFQGSIADEADRLIRTRNRRRTFIAASLVGGLLAIGGVSFWATSSTAKKTNPPTQILAGDLALNELDRLYFLRGASGIAGKVSSGNDQEALLALYWIGSRGHSTLSGLAVGALGDGRIAIRRAAIGALDRMHHTTLALHLTALQAQESTEPDPVIRKNLQRLIDIAQNGE